MMNLVWKLPVSLNGCAIVDIETTGLYPERDEIVTLGVVHHNVLRVFQRTTESAKEFLEFSRRWCYKNLQDKERFAYNCMFETNWLNLSFSELQPFNYARKEDLFNISSRLLHDPLHSGANVPYAWRSYWEKGDLKALEAIVLHNKTCLFKELAILLTHRLQGGIQR